VITVSVRAGDAVAPGEALVTIESPEAGMAQAEVERADAEVTSMRAELQFATAARGRAERLLALKAISRQDYERALADEERARSSLAQAEADAKRARATATQLGATGRTSGEVVLQSPFAGVVLERSAVPGTVVEAGAPLVVVTNPTSLWLTIAAPEHFAGLFRRGAWCGSPCRLFRERPSPRASMPWGRDSTRRRARSTCAARYSRQAASRRRCWPR
jgi:multidrug resistance efflux pump